MTRATYAKSAVANVRVYLVKLRLTGLCTAMQEGHQRLESDEI